MSWWHLLPRPGDKIAVLFALLETEAEQSQSASWAASAKERSPLALSAHFMLPLGSNKEPKVHVAQGKT